MRPCLSNGSKTKRKLALPLEINTYPPTPRSPSWLRQVHKVYCSGINTREKLWTVHVLGRTGPLSECEGTSTVCIRQSFKESRLAIVSIRSRLTEASPWVTPGWCCSHLKEIPGQHPDSHWGAVLKVHQHWTRVKWSLEGYLRRSFWRFP